MKAEFKKIEKIVEKELACSAHNLEHVKRVFGMCQYLAKGEAIDKEILYTAALLHDIARVKEDEDSSGKIDHAVLSSVMSAEILKKLSFKPEKIRLIREVILTHRHRANRVPTTLEAKILYDADKLDAIGAIGIGRAFVWAGRNNAHFFRKVNLKEYLKKNSTAKERGRIKNGHEHSPWIEYQVKLKNIKNTLYLKKSKQIALERTAFMKKFFDRLEKEIKGEA